MQRIDTQNGLVLSSRLLCFAAPESAESPVLSYLLWGFTDFDLTKEIHTSGISTGVGKWTNWINEKNPGWFISCPVINEPPRKEMGLLFSVDLSKWLRILTPGPSTRSRRPLSASWCNVRNTDHVPWHSQQRDKKERQERPRRGRRGKAAGDRTHFFLAHKIHSCKITNILDRSHPRKIEAGARWNRMEIKLGWEDFVLYLSPFF